MDEEKLEAEQMEGLLQRAENCFDRQDWKGAIHCYTKILEINPQDVWSYWERGIARKNNGEYLAALADFNQTLELDPKNFYAFYERALVLEKLQRLKEADNDFQKARELKEIDIHKNQQKNMKKKIIY